MWFDTSLEMLAYSHYVLDDMISIILEDLLGDYEHFEVDVTYGKVTLKPFPVELSSIILPDGYELILELSVGKDIAASSLIGKT